MKIYETIEVYCEDGCLEEVHTKVFLDKIKAKVYFGDRAKAIEDEVRSAYKRVGEYDDESYDVVLKRDVDICDAYECFSAMSYEHYIKLVTHDVKDGD